MLYSETLSGGREGRKDGRTDRQEKDLYLSQTESAILGTKWSGKMVVHCLVGVQSFLLSRVAFEKVAAVSNAFSLFPSRRSLYHEW